jgi:hypothetical protein
MLSMVAAALIVVGVALFVALPLADRRRQGRRESTQAIELARLDHERLLAVAGIRDLEFDRAMSKLSEDDYASMLAKLEDRAMSAMAASDKLRASVVALTAIPSAPAPPPNAIPRAAKQAIGACVGTAKAPRPQDAPESTRNNHCPSCGTRSAPGARFCFQCGGALGQTPQAAHRPE